MNFADCKKIVIPEGTVKIITRKSDGVILWKSQYTNQVPISIDTDGSIYNGTGYKEGYRIRSGGAETENAYAMCTGFIPCKSGDIVRAKHKSGTALHINTSAGVLQYGVHTAINYSDGAKTNLGQLVGNFTGYGIMEGAGYLQDVITIIDNMWVITVPNNADIAYVRLIVVNVGGDGLIVTVNEEIV